MGVLSEYLNSQFSLAQNLDFFIRIAVACLCGACIGLERSKRYKEAGIRTHIIVCCAASLLMIVSKYGFADLTDASGAFFNGIRGADPARIAAQVVSGIGFLGAGSIIVTGRNHVSGLTTAAGLWASACMGLAAGAGYFSCVLVMCTLILLVLEILHKVDKHYIRNSKQMFLYIETNKGVRVDEILSLMNQNGVQVYSFDHFGTDTEDYTGYRLNVEIENKDLTRHGLAAMVTDVDGVVYVSEI